MYAIQRIEDGKFVTTLNLEHSYTDKLQEARIWPTATHANLHLCGNERLVDVTALLMDNSDKNNRR